MEIEEHKQEEFRYRLRCCLRYWQAGLCLRIFLKMLGLTLVVLAGYAVLDFFLAFPPVARIAIDMMLIAVFVLVAIFHLVLIFRLRDRDMAIRADSLLASPRRPVLSGLELSSELDSLAASHQEMRAYLLGKSIQRCHEDLRRLHYRDCFPKREIVDQVKVLGAQLLLAALVFLAGSNAAGTILARIFLPGRDIPPYSKYVFEIDPVTPEVIYGDDTEVKVKISGAPVESRVWMLTRYGGEQHRAACFQESDNVFAQRMEQVVAPLEFCFKTAKARSKWHTVDLRLQPRIALAIATIRPPEYTRLPEKRFFCGHEDFAVYRDSKCKLEITSNRPLLNGMLTIRPHGHGNDVEIARGLKTGSKTVAFEWTASNNAELEISIRDIRGTRNKTPLIVKQNINPDQAPNAVITHPAGFIMATPETSIQLSGYSTDDLGLRRVELVRTVVGYRDRAKRLGPLVPVKRMDIEDQVDLKKLGVVPGEVLEMFLEASDLNPSLMGISASPVVRIEIISEKDYAHNLRIKETLENFLNRYRMVSGTLEEVRDTLRDLQAALEDENLSENDMAEQVQAAQKRLKEAEERLYTLGNDFPIYEMEKGLYDFSRKAGRQAGNLAEQLDTAKGRASLRRAIAGMLEETGAAREEMRSREQDAEQVAKIRRLMECASRFMGVYRQQEGLVRRLQRFQSSTPREDMRLLQALGELQTETRRQLDDLVSDINEHSQPLGDEYEQLKETAIKFAKAIEELEIPATMDKAAASAVNQNGRRAFHFAKLSLEKLDRLMSSCQNDAFGSMCRCELKFGIPKPSMQKTLSQMMQAMGSGAGAQGGAGMGTGGTGSDGYSMQSYSPINIPMFGPERISQHYGGTGVSDGGGGRHGVAGRPENVADQERISTVQDAAPRGQRLPMERVPDKYLEAVKKYFSGEE